MQVCVSVCVACRGEWRMLDAWLYCFPFHSFGTRSLTEPRQAASTLPSLPFPALGLQVCTQPGLGFSVGSKNSWACLHASYCGLSCLLSRLPAALSGFLNRYQINAFSSELTSDWRKPGHMAWGDCIFLFSSKLVGKLDFQGSQVTRGFWQTRSWTAAPGNRVDMSPEWIWCPKPFQLVHLYPNQSVRLSPLLFIYFAMF